VCLIAVAVAGAVWVQPLGRSRDTALMDAARILLTVLGIGGAILRAFPNIPDKTDAYPVIDLTTLAFLALPIVALLLPRITKLKVGETEIDLTEAVAEIKATGDDLSELMQDWMYTLGHVLYQMDTLTDADAIAETFFNFVRDRLGDLKLNVSDNGESNVRIALWLYEETTDQLVFAFSNEIHDAATRHKRFGAREGFVGQAFDEQRFWNEGEATQLPSFVPIRTPPYGYTVVCAAVVSLFEERFGMLTVDKNTPGRFAERPANLIIACGRLIAVALDGYYRALDKSDTMVEK
jgi:hypothetical protein